MPQSGVGSMQGSNEDCLPMKGHTRGGGSTHNVTQGTDTHIFKGGGGTHPQCNPTNRHTNSFGHTHKQTKQTKLYIEAACCLIILFRSSLDPSAQVKTKSQDFTAVMAPLTHNFYIQLKH